MPNYNSVTPEIIAQLEQVVPGRVVVGADVNPDYSRDEMPIYGTRMPEVSIDVLTTEEVAGIVRSATRITSRSPRAAQAPALSAAAPRSAAASSSAPCA